MHKILLILPGVAFDKKGTWVQLHPIPHINEQLYFKGNNYSVAMVKHFVDAVDVPEYKGKTPFTRVILMNL